MCEKTKTKRDFGKLKRDNYFTTSLDRLMVISAAKTLLLGMFGFVKHNFANVFNRLDKETYFRMLKKLHREEINELGWICHLLQQTFNSSYNSMFKITSWAMDMVRRFVRFLTPNGPVESNANLKEDSGFLLFRG